LRKFFRYIIPLVISIPIFILLGLSNLAPYISPKTNAHFAFLGLAFPYLFWANIIVFLYWILTNKKIAFIAIIMVIFSWKSLTRTYTYHVFTPAPAENHLKVMSFNVQIFGLYNWKNNLTIRDSIFAFIEKENPDIICFQEYFYSDEPGYFETSSILINQMGYSHFHEQHTHTILGAHHFGIATFSKIPLLNRQGIWFSNDKNNVAIATDLALENDTLRIINAHLSSVRLQDDDYNVMDVENDFLNHKNLNRGKRVYTRLQKAFERRVDQTNQITEIIDKSPYPVIFCADINDTPVSYSYNQFKTRLDDAFLISGKGRGNTYIGKLPSYRIDYIFHDKTLSSTNFIRYPEELSDHHAISCIINLE
jgi:endonuclease/exonuclease/phosphatase family metal-dependent hydrolase